MDPTRLLGVEPAIVAREQPRRRKLQPLWQSSAPVFSRHFEDLMGPLVVSVRLYSLPGENDLLGLPIPSVPVGIREGTSGLGVRWMTSWAIIYFHYRSESMKVCLTLSNGGL